MRSKIDQHYGSGYEDTRLRTGSGKLELERVRELMSRFLPPPPAIILDIGGGTGAHGLRLALAGYRVHLLDIVPLHIELAEKASASQPQAPLAETIVGDARSLPWNSAIADAALLFGPLYHLTDREEREISLREVFRVLKPGGILLAAGISRFASTLDGLRAGYLADPVFAAIVDRDLIDGQHRNPTGRVEYFTDTFFHHPEELRSEVLGAGFETTGLFGIEGPGWLAPDFDVWWESPELRKRLLGLARRLESEPSLVGISAHLMVSAYKP